MVCAFFGHRDAPQEISGKLKKVLSELIENEQADTFYVGSQGDFDFIVRRTLEELKIIYPHIECIVALAYMPDEKTVCVGDNFPDTVYPEGLEYTPRRFAIDKRNRWMIKQADTVIAYVKYSFGGAARYKELAERQGKRIINIA